MTTTPEPSVVTAEHAAAFGYIVHTLAKIEHHMQTAVAGMLDVDLATATILMAEGQYRQKRQTLLNLNKTRGINGNRCLELEALLEEIGKYSDLRNRVAHSIWTAGREPASIKPMYLLVRGQEPKPVGHWHNEKDYTLAELQDAANKLNEKSLQFVELLEDTGLIARVEANIAAIADETDS